MRCKKLKEKIMLYLYSELGDRDKSELENHLKECSGCAQDLEYTKQVFQAVEENKPDEIPDANWENSWQIIRSKVKEKQEKRKNFFFEYKKAFAAAGMISIFIIGLVIGKFMLTSRQQTTLASTSSPVSIDQALSNHFENLRPLLIDHANYSPTEINESTITIDKGLLKNLLLQNYLLKKAVSNQDDTSKEQLLEDIELILREISNLESKDDQTLSLIKDTIDQRDILLKMEVLKKI